MDGGKKIPPFGRNDKNGKSERQEWRISNDNNEGRGHGD